MHGLSFDIAHLLAGSLVLVSFMMLYQDRLYALHQRLRAARGRAGLSVAWQAYIQDAPHLYITAAIALLFKAIIIPVVLHRMIVKLGIHREIETVGRHRPYHAARHGARGARHGGDAARHQGADLLVREDLAFSLSVVLLGLLMMVTRQNAVSQVVGFMSLENGLVLAATGAKGMPLRGRDQRRLLHPDRLHRHRHFPVPHSRAFRHASISGHSTATAGEHGMSFDPVTFLFVDPGDGRGADRADARLEAHRLCQCRCGLPDLPRRLVAAVGSSGPLPGPTCSSTSLNTVFVVLITFVGFTTSVFSASLRRVRGRDRQG